MGRILLIVLVAGLGACSRKNDALEQRVRQLEEENRALQARLAQPAPAPVPAEPVTIVKRETVKVPDTASLEQVRGALSDANRQIADLEGRLQRAAAQAEETQAEQARQTAAFDEARRKLAAAEQTLDAAQRDARSAYDRIAVLERQMKQARDQSSAQQTQSLDAERRLRELEDFDRRREALLAGLLRRYREVGDLYRAAGATIDERRALDSQPARTVDMPRINEALAAAEEDLRQLRALNVQAARILRK